MKLKFFATVFLFLIALRFSVLTPTRADDKPTPPAKPAAEANLTDYKKHVAPYLKAHCYKCHGEKVKKKDLNLEKIDGDMIKGPDAEKWETIFERVRDDEMPPKKQPRPDKKKTERVLEWIGEELKKAPEKK
jgi:hypothetical protein